MQQNEPLVSVIMPCYKHEDYVTRAIESVVLQCHKRIEIIIVDDHSPDRTYENATRALAAHKHRFVRVVAVRNAANMGAHFSLNRGMDLAHGEILSFINSDDLYLPRRITMSVDALRSQSAGMVFSLVQPIDTRDSPTADETLCHAIRWRPLVASDRLPSLSWGFLWRQLTASTGNIVMHSALARRVGYFTPLLYCHDWDYLLRATFYTEPILLEEVLYGYRLHGENSFRSLSSVAEHDTRYVIQGHFRRVGTQVPENHLAAAPQNWPLVFDALVDDLGYRAHYDELYRPYATYHRTVDSVHRQPFGD